MCWIIHGKCQSVYPKRKQCKDREIYWLRFVGRKITGFFEIDGGIKTNLIKADIVKGM